MLQYRSVEWVEYCVVSIQIGKQMWMLDSDEHNYMTQLNYPFGIDCDSIISFQGITYWFSIPDFLRDEWLLAGYNRTWVAFYPTPPSILQPWDEQLTGGILLLASSTHWLGHCLPGDSSRELEKTGSCSF